VKKCKLLYCSMRTQLPTLTSDLCPSPLGVHLESGTQTLTQRLSTHTAYCTLHTAYCTLHTAYCILYTAHCTLHTAHCTLHTAYCILHTAYCTLHTAYCILHTAYCTLHTAHCTLHTAHCTLHTAHCTLHTAHCTLHSSSRRRSVTMPRGIVLCTTLRPTLHRPFPIVQASSPSGANCRPCACAMGSYLLSTLSTRNWRTPGERVCPMAYLYGLCIWPMAYGLWPMAYGLCLIEVSTVDTLNCNLSRSRSSRPFLTLTAVTITFYAPPGSHPPHHHNTSDLSTIIIDQLGVDVLQQRTEGGAK
jgi:hypothetical protein